MPGRRQRLGQHMLVDRKILEKIITAAGISKSEIVCEAGTGSGALTAELCRHAKKVLSYEVDRALYEKSKDGLKFDNLELTRGDLFDTENLGFDVFVSNLPYSRSRDAIEWLAVQKFDRAVIMVQREFAEKLQAAPGCAEYRAVSALAAYCFRIMHVTQVDRRSFSPQPSVESSVVKVVPVRTVSSETVKKLSWLFSRRNKKASSVAARLGISDFEAGDERIDQLLPSKLVELAEMIKKQ